MPGQLAFRISAHWVFLPGGPCPCFSFSVYDFLSSPLPETDSSFRMHFNDYLLLEDVLIVVTWTTLPHTLKTNVCGVNLQFMSPLLGHNGLPNPPANTGDVGTIPGSRRSHGEGNGNPLQYSCLGNPMDRVTWQAAVHGVVKESDTT